MGPAAGPLSPTGRGRGGGKCFRVAAGSVLVAVVTGPGRHGGAELAGEAAGCQQDSAGAGR